MILTLEGPCIIVAIYMLQSLRSNTSVRLLYCYYGLNIKYTHRDNFCPQTKADTIEPTTHI